MNERVYIIVMSFVILNIFSLVIKKSIAKHIIGSDGIVIKKGQTNLTKDLNIKKNIHTNKIDELHVYQETR